MSSNPADVITFCQEHLEKTNSRGTIFESYLTKYVLINIYAYCENMIKDIILKRVDMHDDAELTSYVMGNIRLRGIKIENLKGNVLNKFNAKYSEIFDSKLNKQISQEYDNIMTNRHPAAHGASINMSFDEVSKTFGSVRRVLDTLSNMLNP